MHDPHIEVHRSNLSDRNWTIRSNSAEALGKTGDRSAIPALITALRDELAVVRSAAAAALGAIGDASAVPALVRALKDSSKDLVRPNVAAALVRIGNSHTLPRKILALETLTSEGKIEVLDELRRVRYKDNNTTLRYDIPDIRTLCNSVIDEQDFAFENGAQAVLDWLDGKELLIASMQENVNELGELLLPISGSAPETMHNTLLRRANEPDDGD